ncbi:TetR/AcrR family transcriptional regulator [Klenkia brasiliensis]|uniref:Transcriptional regulator, TetR family n=1 Tax=Klenkia brasiliensis TaxID=333142 RepID=A0A1G7YKQ9_9ACTN|nr:TetR/AcrR family transcriptional regulator [Klenkia brasiliensis]SDG96984.1 transcriptional regulator, TetR family [Klenkia brasiliensis]
MPRPQAYATADAVRAARGVFWVQGFEGASVPDLERATGLNRSSIYHAFGSKRGLFDAAVQSYLDEVVRPRLAVLTGAEVAPDALVEYLTGLRAAVAAGDDHPDAAGAGQGCLLVNTATAPIGGDAAVRAVVAGYRAELRTAFERGVRARFPGRDPAELADTLTSLVVAAFALARVDPDGAVRSLDVALAQTA